MGGSAVSSGQASVLIVDDDAILVRAWRRVLDRAFLCVEEASSLSEAHDKLDGQPFDVVLLDLRLGKESGADLLPAIERLSPPPRVAVISGYFSGDDAVDLHNHCSMVVPKPISNTKLVELVESLFKTRESTDWLTCFCIKQAMSRRESQVLVLAAHGVQNKEIASEIGCATSTVISYWKRIFAKTKCRTRSEVLSMIIQWQSQQRIRCLECPEWARELL